jgi:hypothetical protein
VPSSFQQITPAFAGFANQSAKDFTNAIIFLVQKESVVYHIFFTFELLEKE